ncbi:MAG: NB-ARC domain-containing protein [Leptolyngbyaceae cyanobacterium bins.302]|nr:NB-ARC domain-containing protein [Leptolyngbyaceae cyanobacterium bins.302]
MNLEEACRAADAAVYARTGQHLSDVQMLILQGALRGETYEQIASSSHYSVSYIKKFAGPTLWNLLSQGLGETVSKTNFQTALSRTAIASSIPSILNQSPTSLSPRPTPVKLVGVPHASVFFGRTHELGILHQWILLDDVRLVLLSGMGGIGKTALIARFARQNQTEFEMVVVRSLNCAPSLQNVLENLLTTLLGEQIALPSSMAECRLQLLEVFRTRRCLIVLDNVEGILQGEQLSGQYRQDYENFGTWLHQLAEEEHQSCVVLLGREQPSALVSLAGETLPIRSLRVRGLAEAHAKQLLQAKGVNSHQSGIEELIQLKRGNPLALQIVATTIQELFDGNVTALLKQGTVIIGDTLQTLLSEQFERLSELEKGVIYWLALEPQSLAKLKENTRFMVLSLSELLKTLQSLKRRSLLEEDPSLEAEEVNFTLQPIVLRYTINQLVNQAVKDFSTLFETQSIRDLGLIRTHILFVEHQFYQLRQSRIHTVSQLLVKQLQTNLGHQRNINYHLHDLLLSFHEKSVQAIGYATTNLVNLQRIIESQRL